VQVWVLSGTEVWVRVLLFPHRLADSGSLGGVLKEPDDDVVDPVLAVVIGVLAGVTRVGHGPFEREADKAVNGLVADGVEHGGDEVEHFMLAMEVPEQLRVDRPGELLVGREIFAPGHPVHGEASQQLYR